MTLYSFVFRCLKCIGARMCFMKCFLVLLLIFVMPLSFRTAFCADKPLTKTYINVGVTQSTLLGSNKNDLAAALKTFTKTVAKQIGYDVEITVSIFKNMDELAALPEDRRPHIVILVSWDFLGIEKEGWLTPVTATTVRGGNVYSSFELLVPANSKAKSIEDLRGKNISILFMPQTQIGLPWLRSLLQEHKLGTLESFFGNITMENNPMKAILPVFLGQKDAGLITAEKFKLMAELNPQLNKMRTIAVSKPLVCGITGFNRMEWETPGIKQDFIDAMLKLHLSPAGQQVLHLFKADQLVAYRPEYMETIRAVARTLSQAP